MSSWRLFESGGEREVVADEYVVDTDIVSYLFREDSRVEPYRSYLTGSSLAVSFMTKAELDRWALARQWGDARRRLLDGHIDQFATIRVDRDLCRIWARAMEQGRTSGRPIQVGDAWVAATAIRLGVPLITNNHNDYADVSDLVVVRPDIV
ncbi:MAG: PIN domain-containing protein [Chloroflexota bacterium]|nr:PIN domain-containing protein [Chloroflexota bacterium]